jgi:amidohydrolase
MNETGLKIKKLTTKYFPEIVSIRRHLHRYPELSGEEHETMEFVASKLNEYGIPCQKGIAETGVVGLIRGRNPDGMCIALRADLDALAIQELNDHDYCSLHPGKMHACGHDVHMACLLGAARILNEIKDQLSGTVKLIFQPSEETYPGGARRMIAAGVLDNPAPSFVIAQHVFPLLPAGHVGFKQGIFMASTDEFTITVKGRGGHGAMPHIAVDPILIASHIVIALQQITSRNADPLVPTVVTVGRFIGEGRTNVIPDEVQLQGTIRTFEEEWRKEMHQKIETLVTGIATSMGGEASLTIAHGYPFVFNDERLTGRLTELAAEYLGHECVKPVPQKMGAEDFSYYGREVPSCLFVLGMADHIKGIGQNLHTARFNVDESCLETGTGILTWFAVRLLGKGMTKDE